MKKLLEDEKNISQITFFDRALGDPLAYTRIFQPENQKNIYDLVKNHLSYDAVFFLEQLPTYVNDSVRFEDEKLGKQIHEQLYQTYESLGCNIIRVPAFEGSIEESVQKRIKFILNNIPQNNIHIELEKKFHIDHTSVLKNLEAYQWHKKEVIEEENHTKIVNTSLLRVRKKNDSFEFTIKGKSSSDEYDQRFEENIDIPQEIAQDLIPLFDISYNKTRTNYIPLHDRKVVISLDKLPNLGEFVEIEAPSKNQIDLWEKRLQLKNPMSESYSELARKK